MCGRYELKASAKTLMAHFQGSLRLAAHEVQPRDEIGPTDAVLVLTGGEQGILALQAQWGLVGSFLDAAPKNPVINLHSEGLLTKPFYSRLLRQKRCILPATAYFEAQIATGGSQQKIRMSGQKEQPLWLAGIFDHHPTLGLSCALLTTEANDSITAVHHRMPVILNREATAFWLAEHAEFPEADYLQLIAPAVRGSLKAEIVVAPAPSPQLAFEFV